MYGSGGGGNWGGQWGSNMGPTNNTRMQMQNANQQSSMLTPNQVSRTGSYNQNQAVPQQRALYPQQQPLQNAYKMQQQQPSQNVFNMQQPVRNSFNMPLQQQPTQNQNMFLQQQQQQPNPNLYLQQQQLLLQSQLQAGMGMGGVGVPDQRMQNLQQLALGVGGGFAQQQAQLQALAANPSANPFVNPSTVAFYQNTQQNLAPAPVNNFIQQQQQAFNQQWQTQPQVSNKQPGGQHSNGPGSFTPGSQLRNNYDANTVSRSDLNSVPAAAPPAPPPPVPVEKPSEQAPPPPPTSSSQTGNQNELGTVKNIVSTNLSGLLDLISGSSKKEKDPAVIPGLGDLDDFHSPKIVHDSPKRKTPEKEQSSSWIDKNKRSEPNARQNVNDNSADKNIKKAEEVKPSLPLPTPKNESGDTKAESSSAGEASETASNSGSIASSGTAIPLGTEVNPSGSGAVYTRAHLKVFDKTFRDWEKQFEDWGKSNAGHTDRNAYEKFMGQWEAYREQLVKQRKCIVESILRNKDKESNTETQLEHEMGPTKNLNTTATAANPTTDHSAKPTDTPQQWKPAAAQQSVQQISSQAPASKEIGQKTSKDEECRDLSKLIRNPFAVSGARNANFTFRNPQASNTNRPPLLGGRPNNPADLRGRGPSNSSFGTTQSLRGRDFRGPGPRIPSLTEPVKQQGQNHSNAVRPESPVERVSRQSRNLNSEPEFFNDDEFSANMHSFEDNRASLNSSSSNNSRGNLPPTNLRQPAAPEMNENRFINPQQQPGRPSMGDTFATLRSQTSFQREREDAWNSFGGPSNQRRNNQEDANPFTAAERRPDNPFSAPERRPDNPFAGPERRPDNPFCEPSVLQNPFMDRPGPRAHLNSGNLHRDRIQNPFNSGFSSVESEVHKPNIPAFASSHREDMFDSIQSEIAKQIPQYQPRLPETSAPFLRRPERFPVDDAAFVGTRRRNDFGDEYDDRPAVIDYGHGRKETSGISSVSKHVPQSFMVDFEDDDDSGAGVTIDYGHGTKAPVVTTLGQPNIPTTRDIIPEVFNRKKEPDYDEEDYMRYAEREERNQYDYQAPRREQRIAPPEFLPGDGRGPRPPYGHFPHGHSYDERQKDPFFGLAVNPPDDGRPSKPLFPIGNYEEPIRIDSDIRGLGSSFSGPPVGELRQAPPEIRRAPPRDLEPISPDGSLGSGSGSTGRDRGRNRELLDDRSRKRDAIISERAKAEDLLVEIARDRARSRERETRAKISRTRSRSKDRDRDRARSRSRSRDRDRDRISRDRDRVSRDGRRGGRESPRRGKESDYSPRRSRREDSPPRRVRRDRTRSPIERDRRVHSSGRNPYDLSARRKSLSPRRRDIVRVEEILNLPGRKTRPAQMVIFMRGLPGSGKTHVAKLIKDRELEFKESAPRILSLDDYFMVETEKTVKDPVTGKSVKEKVSTYEYDPALESKYMDDLFKTFRKTIEGGLFSFIILDCVNDRVKHFQEMSNFAKAKRFQVYIAELEATVEECAKRNIHNRTPEQIRKLQRNWERTPSSYTKLDVRTMLHDDSIQDIQMEDVSDIEDLDDVICDDVKVPGEDGGPDVEIIDPDEEDEPWATSKWETSEDKLNKLDGLARKRKSADSEDEGDVPLSMEQWLQAHLPEDYSVRYETAPGKKRVRWADIEERREQERVRKFGFVVGSMGTNWNRLSDPTFGNAALVKTKYI